jgi:hypothetical protein
MLNITFEFECKEKWNIVSSKNVLEKNTLFPKKNKFHSAQF